MRIISRIGAVSAVIVLTWSLAGIPAHSQAADNSRQNKDQASSGDKNSADNQPNAQPDRQLTADVRKAIVGDKDLSTYGHNVKIISEHGKVTLKGPVHTDEESKNIEAKAVEVAGSGNVNNMLAVKGDKAR